MRPTMINEVPIISCTFCDEAQLYLAYMPFLKGGGLFVRTKIAYAMGDLVSLSVELLGEGASYLVDGKIAWITPKSAQANRVAGIGVQFIGENSRYFSNKIETYLAGMLKSSQLTDTI